MAGLPVLPRAGSCMPTNFDRSGAVRALWLGGISLGLAACAATSTGEPGGKGLMILTARLG